MLHLCTLQLTSCAADWFSSLSSCYSTAHQPRTSLAADTAGAKAVPVTYSLFDGELHHLLLKRALCKAG